MPKVSPEVAAYVGDQRQSDGPYSQVIETWVEDLCRREGIKTEDLTLAQWQIVTLKIPCDIFCWRVGGPVTYPPNGVCPECGHEKARKTVWDHILQSEVDPG